MKNESQLPPENPPLSVLNETLEEVVSALIILNTQIQQINTVCENVEALAEKISLDLEEMAFELQYPGLDKES